MASKTPEQTAERLDAMGEFLFGHESMAANRAACEAGAAALRAQAQTQAELRKWAIYCFNRHGNDAHLYNGLAALAGMEPPKENQ